MLFREWGHAALCVDRICFNYGVTDFSRPVGLATEVLRGEARFWLGLTTYEQTLATYFGHDRSVFRQDLDLPLEAREELLGMLAADLVPGQSEYVYNHFTENCTTRVRDYVDAVTDGALSRVADMPEVFLDGSGELGFRAQIRRGLVTRPLLLWLSEVGVGGAADGPITPYDAMFVPEGLRHGISRGLGSEPVQLRRGRDGDVLAADPGSRPYLPWLFATAALLGAGLLVPRFARPARFATAGVLGLVGVAATLAAVLSPLPEFRSSLAALVVPPTDLLLAAPFAARYARFRLAFGAVAILALVVLGAAQPIAWTGLAALVPIAAMVVSERRRP